MTSPARRHYQRVTAAREAGDAIAGPSRNSEQYALMMAAMWEARRALKEVKSTEGKVALKRRLLPQFDAYIEGVLEGGSGARDEVLTRVMIWRFDTGDLPGALAIARYALDHDLDTPDSFERDTPSLVAEQMAEETLGQLERADPDEHPALAAHLAALLSQAHDLIAGADMHDQISAKFHKAHGYALRGIGDADAALEQLRRAYELNDRAGVKQDIQKLEREIAKRNTGSQPDG